MIDIIWRAALTAVIAYLLGSLSFAVIITRVNNKGDIRNMGSGNAGFTNVLRSVGVVPAVLTFAFDFLKGVIAVLIGWWIFSTIDAGSTATIFEYTKYGRYIAGLFAIVGHMFPIYFNFKGGKGVVTLAALMAVVDWRVLLMGLATFLIIFVITRIISLSSIIATSMLTVYTFIVTFFFDYLPNLGTPNEVRVRYIVISTLCIAVIGLLVVVKHKENIVRLMHGEEKKLKVKKSS